MAGDNEEANSQRLESSFGTSSSSFRKQPPLFLMNQLGIPQSNVPQFRAQMQNLENGERVGIPPSHPQIPPVSPYSQIQNNRAGMQNLTTNPGPSNSRSSSQPSFFSADSLPPLSPSPFRDPLISDHASADTSMEDRDGNSRSFLFTRGSASKISEILPPRKAHRRSNSDVPFGFMPVMQSSLPLLPLRSPGTPGAHLVHSVKKELSWESNSERIGEKKTEREVMDDFFNACMNLNNIDAFNSSGTDGKAVNENHEDLDSRASGNSSDNEATSSVNEGECSVQKREGLKRNAGEDITPSTRHCRSVSMDSFIGKMNFGDESPKMPPTPGTLPGHLSPTNSANGNQNAFTLEFSNGDFSAAELKKIMASEKLTEIALSDPKRAKRILANRQSAARSKERKMRYITELEHKVQTLQNEATTLSSQLTLLQKDSAALTNQNNEMKFRLQAMEQQAHLRDALNEALTAEAQRLKVVATSEISGEKFQQLSISPQMFQLRPQFNARQIQQQQPSSSTSKNSESKN